MYRFGIVLLLTALTLAPVIVDARPGDATVTFLTIPVGVRSTGMGEAFTAVADDASGIWWNPAALAFIQRSETGRMHCNWLPKFHLPDLYIRNYDFFHHIKGLGTFGANYTFFNEGKLPRTNELGQTLGYVHAYEWALTGAFSSKVNENLALGVAAKYIYSHLADWGVGQEKGSAIASGVAVDLSMLYRVRFSPMSRLQFGVSLVNLGSKMSYIDVYQADPIPTNLRIGEAIIIQYEDYIKFTLSAELEKELTTKHSDNSTDPFYKAIFTSWYNNGGFMSNDERNEFITHFGTELWLMDIFALRFGVLNDPVGSLNFTTYGFSLQYVFVRIDYSRKRGDSLQSGEERFQLSFYFDHIKRDSPTPWKW